MFLLIRLLYSIFPSPLITRKNTRLTKKSLKYTFQWKLPLSLVKSRWERHFVEPPLKSWDLQAHLIWE